MLPWEGAINLNFTVTDNLFENSAGWAEDLGFDKKNVFTIWDIVDCRVQINNEI